MTQSDLSIAHSYFQLAPGQELFDSEVTVKARNEHASALRLGLSVFEQPCNGMPSQSATLSIPKCALRELPAHSIRCRPMGCAIFPKPWGETENDLPMRPPNSMDHGLETSRSFKARVLM